MITSGYPDCRRAARSKRGSALLVTLLVLSLMAIIVVAFLGTMSWELQASARSYQNQQARGIATLGLDTALSQLRSAFGQWDAPYGKLSTKGLGVTGGFETNPPANYYSISPGILTSWSYTSVNAVTNYPLFSLPTDGTTNLANLNAPEQNGTYPILGANTPLNVYWVNVLSDPQATASQTNQVVGRYAFWIDDENAKININTADGTYNGTLPPQQCGLGWGTPSAVSLQELQQGGTYLSATCASNIVAIARTVGFNSPGEILRASGTTPDLYTNNVFNITTMSRSPDFNIFGQPKMPLIPVAYTNSYFANGPNFLYNLATLQPLREIFPSQSGGITPYPVITGVLPPLTMADPFSLMNSLTGVAVSTNRYSSQKWPLPTGQIDPTSNNLSNGSGTGSANDPTGNALWGNGWLIANYLAGTNAVGMPITWPALPGSTAAGFRGKYTPRQIDSITMQILNFSGVDTSPDAGTGNDIVSRSNDLAFRGWLSGELVNGIGRNPKLDKVMMEFTTQAGVAPVSPSTIGTAPKVNAQLYLELWFPSGFQGVSLFHKDAPYGGLEIGNTYQRSIMNAQDMGQNLMNNTNNLIGTPGPLPKVTANGGSYPPDGGADSYSYWGNNLLQTVILSGTPASASLNTAGIASNPNGGVDWYGNNPAFVDPDQTMAKKYHPWLATNSAGALGGSGPTGTSDYIAPYFQMEPMLNPSNTPNANNWAPGQYRCVENIVEVNGGFPGLTMSTNAMAGSGTTLAIFGGIQYLSENHANRGNTEPSAVPLDAMRGSVWNTGAAGPNLQGDQSRTQEPFTGSGMLSTPYTNVLAAVLPVNVSVPVPATGSATTGVAYVYDYVADPLVNKFPGDWANVASFSAPTTTMQYTSAGTSNPDNSVCAISTESTQKFIADGLQDPESYWLPTIDNIATATYASGIPASGPAVLEMPQIPRTSRFPSIGYLQYVRTGIMPDTWPDTTVPYSSLHGTPFRLLNFNASTDASQQTQLSGGLSYPDWAMLDLFYVPSSFLSPGSPYEAYAGTNYASALANNDGSSTGIYYYSPNNTYSNTNAVNNMYLYGTYGGATSGRINPNGSVIYTTNVNMPTPGITRTVPMAALLDGITYSQTISGPAVQQGNNDYWTPAYTGGTSLTDGAETTLAAAIASYLSTNSYGPGGNGPAPLRMPGEICNVPAISALMATQNPQHTRNDLVRQIIGNLTT